ncbi:MAG: carboxypeptidase-like regulatory domain-containing protein [Methanothrix sp.]|nr:carboxypeptidase-like regulatory domain-containing protein [Methanothrix sp.]
MGKIIFIIAGLIIALFLADPSFSQGMGGSKAYDQRGTDWMGTPVSSGNQVSTVVPVVPDYLSTYSTGSAGPDPFGTGVSTLSLLLVPADPASEGLVAVGGEKLANQLYLQSGKNLITEGAVSLGEQYVLWARVNGKGSFLLYDYNRLVLNQGYVTPGWYRINGTYADYLGAHIYRFVSAGLASNNLSIIVGSGSYPTSFSLTGKVLDQSGQGMSGVKVILSNNEGGKFSTTTNSAGYYALDVSAGVYLVNAELPGYVFTQTSVQTIAGIVSAARPVVGTPVGSTPPSIWT